MTGTTSGAWNVQAKKHWTAPMTRTVAPEEVHLDEEGGEVGEVLGVPHGGLGHHDGEEDAAGPAHPLGDVDHVQPDDEPDGQADQEQSEAGVQLGQVAQRDGDALGHLWPEASPAWGPAPVAAVPAAITSARRTSTP